MDLKLRTRGDEALEDTENDPLTYKIIGAAMVVHSELGPGLLESTYEHCLAWELRQLGLNVQQQLPLPVVYKQVKLDCGYRIDLLVNDEVVVEAKSVEAIAPIHESQLLSYLKLSKKRKGLLINFNTVRLRDGIKRRVL